MRAVLYIRVSTDKQESENQALQLRDYCKHAGHDILEEYVDVISGKEDSRPAYDRMFKDAHKHLFDLIVFWDLSRFSRSGTKFTMIKIQELDNLGISWVSYQEQFLSTVGPFKDVVISIFATIAKLERERISERTKAGLARARKEGKQVGRVKGQKDLKPRKRTGYYNNKNRAKGTSKKGVSTSFIKESNVSSSKTDAPLFEEKKPLVLRRWFCVSNTCPQGSWYSAKDVCPTCRRKGRKTPLKETEE